MVLKVDLQCEKCYRKVKKALCKFPQIRDQTYDEKNNQVMIKVVCCSPEKIRDRLCCKGGGSIKSIGIKEPEKPKPPAGEPKPAPPQKPPPPPEKKKKPPSTPPDDDDVKKSDTTKTVKNPALAPEPTKPALTTALVPSYPAYPPAPVNAGCMDFYGGHPGGPCQTDYGSMVTVCLPLTYNYFSEENPQACVIM
ncbi:hypothetical protein M0R45_006056 [Rubus argutus]|uniref:Uncharacterized protein n=1 Tax=Rubus argutus TaxID=59490 RepID=A0AAW1YPD1_RUBAR